VYSEVLLDHLRNPRRAGYLEPPAVTVKVENPICGDIMTVSAEVDGNVIRDVRFKVRGCTASIAAGSALTDLLIGRCVEDLPTLDPAHVEVALGGLPNESKHAARLASDAAKALVERLSKP
jgi:nitrogen fixation NifU-like protein